MQNPTRKSPDFFVLLAYLFLSAGCEAQPVQRAEVDEANAVVAGPNIPVPSQFKSLPLVEPHLSAHPGNPDHLLAGAMVVTDINRPYESCRLVSFTSTDGGKSWTETVHDWWGYDPWTAIAADGTAIMSWIGTAGSFQDRYPVQLFTSGNGGITWSKSVQTLAGMHDGTKLVEHQGRFFFTTVRFREQEGADVMLYARAAGEEFVEVGRLDGKGERLNFCEPAVNAEGTVVIPASSQASAWVQLFHPAAKTLSPPQVIVKRPGSWRGYARMVSGIRSKAYANYVFFVRAMGNAGLRINRSTDGGRSWSGDLRIDLFDAQDPVNALVPSAAVNEQGVLGISWVNQGNNQSGNEVFFTASFDGGRSFIRPVLLTSAPSKPASKMNGDVANKFPGGGHYLGLAARADGSFQAIWSDSRNGVFQLQTCRITH